MLKSTDAVPPSAILTSRTHDSNHLIFILKKNSLFFFLSPVSDCCGPQARKMNDNVILICRRWRCPQSLQSWPRIRKPRVLFSLFCIQHPICTASKFCNDGWQSISTGQRFLRYPNLMVGALSRRTKPYSRPSSFCEMIQLSERTTNPAGVFHVPREAPTRRVFVCQDRQNELTEALPTLWRPGGTAYMNKS